MGQNTRIDKISRDKIIDELKRAAEVFNYIEFKRHDFNKVANISSLTVKREFGSWEKALAYLAEIGIDLKCRRKGYFNDKELFDEMERIWTQLGHRPSIIEWDAGNPKISHSTYIRYFKGWQNACLKFIEYKMGSSILTDDELSDTLQQQSIQSSTPQYKQENTRTIPLGIRLKILDRDNFRCVFCGRSPATDVGVKLHIDHKIPFSKGGRSSIDNLQTLCQECNLGKSDKEIGKNTPNSRTNGKT